MPYNSFTYRPEQADIDIQRSQFKMSHSNKFSGKVGDLIPFLCQEVLPGDTFKVQTSKVLRFTQFVNPIMDNAWLDTYYFYVPNRLIWEHWANFMGESEVAWMPQTTYSIPQINIPLEDSDGNGFSVHSVADYLGITPELSSSVNHTLHVNALPFRAYAKICEDWFRPEQLTDPLVIYTGDNTVNGAQIGSDDYGRSCYLGSEPFVVAKNSDYFTACLPAPQSGPDVQIPSDGLIPVIPSDTDWFDYSDETKAKFVGHYTNVKANLSSSGGSRVATLDSSDYGIKSLNKSDTGSKVNFTNLAVDLEEAGMSIAKLRTAFQIQKFYEKCARGGRRYIEMIKSHFSVNSPDARMQRSEYLGGSRIPIHISEIVSSDHDHLGELGSTSRTLDTDGGFTKSFTEHGYLFGVCCVRYDHSYSSSIPKHFIKKTMMDYFWPVFSCISEQPIFVNEIFPLVTDSQGVNDLERDDLSEFMVFGYNEAWADYRHTINTVHGYLRPNIVGGLGSWSFADNYSAAAPRLSEGWICEDPTNVDDTLVTSMSLSGFQFWADFFIDEIVTRPMPLHSIPGLVDHF